MPKTLTPQQREQRARQVRKMQSALKRRSPSSFGSLRVLPSGVVQARYVGPDEQRYKAPLTFDTLTDADAWLAGVRHQITLETWISPIEREAEARLAKVVGVTVAELFDAYLAEGDLRPRTVDLYSYQFNRLIKPGLGDCEVASLTPTDVAEWRMTLPPAPRQRDQASDLLRAVLNLGLDREIIFRNPAARSRRKTKDGTGRASRREVPRLTREEVATMAATIQPERSFAVLLAAYTGVRFGEMAALRRSDLELTRNESGKLIAALMTISRAVTRPRAEDGIRHSVEGKPKSDAGRRSVAIPIGLLGALDDHLREYAQPADDGLLFSSQTGDYLHPSLLFGIKPGIAKHGEGRAHPTKGRGYYLARAVAGRSDANWHQLRAFAISEAVDSGAAPADLLLRFGHTDLRTSGLYQRAAADADRALAERLPVVLPTDLRPDLHVVHD